MNKPNIEITDNNIYLKNQIYGLIRNAFGHILRNSIDHGLESSEERLSKGKSPQGNIRVSLVFQNQALQITYKDDGRGLNIQKIRQKALENQLINETDYSEDNEIAQLIFRSGLSTAEQVTEISGRGVGMDAVKKFFEKEKGGVEVQLLTPDSTYEEGYCPFQIIFMLPKHYTAELPSLDLNNG